MPSAFANGAAQISRIGHVIAVRYVRSPSATPIRPLGADPAGRPGGSPCAFFTNGRITASYLAGARGTSPSARPSSPARTYALHTSYPYNADVLLDTALTRYLDGLAAGLAPGSHR